MVWPPFLPLPTHACTPGCAHKRLKVETIPIPGLKIGTKSSRPYLPNQNWVTSAWPGVFWPHPSTDGHSEAEGYQSYVSPGDFPAADCWVQLEAYMSSHFIIFIHLGAQVFALAGCSWLAVNSQLLFSWNPQLKLWANMTGNQIGTWIKMFRISERCLVFICFNQVKPTHLGKRIGGEPETHPDTFAKARLARKPVFSQWWVKFNTCHPIRHFSGFSYFPRI